MTCIKSDKRIKIVSISFLNTRDIILIYWIDLIFFPGGEKNKNHNMLS